MEIMEIKCASALVPSRLPELRYCLNPYVGCEHGCKYCYVPSVLRDEDLALKWGRLVKVKTNLLEVLEAELETRGVGSVGVGTATDPYQPVEARLELTRRSLKLLSLKSFPASIQTKSDLILRDADLVASGPFDVGVTITTLDEELARKLEPGAPSPEARAQILKELSSRGVETWLFYGPVIPGVNDDEATMAGLVKLAKETKSKLIYDKLNLKRFVLRSLRPFLEEWDPKLLRSVPALASPNSPNWKKIFLKLESLCAKLGVQAEPAFPELKLKQLQMDNYV